MNLLFDVGGKLAGIGAVVLVLWLVYRALELIDFYEGRQRAAPEPAFPAQVAGSVRPSDDHWLVRSERYIAHDYIFWTAECACGARMHALPSADACKGWLEVHCSIETAIGPYREAR